MVNFGNNESRTPVSTASSRYLVGSMFVSIIPNRQHMYTFVKSMNHEFRNLCVLSLKQADSQQFKCCCILLVLHIILTFFSANCNICFFKLTTPLCFVVVFVVNDIVF